MKRVISIFLLLCILVSFCGCESNKKNTYHFNEDRYINPFDKNFIFKTEFEEYSQDVKVIKYSKTNISDETLYWTFGVSLVMFKDHEWQTVHGKKEYAFQYVTAVVEPGDTITGELNLEEQFFLPLEPGLYCLLSDGHFSEDFVIVEN